MKLLLLLEALVLNQTCEFVGAVGDYLERRYAEFSS
jgi:hypothetical protein